MPSNSMDLIGPVTDTLIKNQSEDTGEKTLLKINGLFHEYSHDSDLFIADRLANKMRAEIGWFEKITNHGPSVGDFYEYLVQSALEEVLPDNLRLGTGFIYDSLKRLVSSQIDLIIYTDQEKAPIYKRGNFVVIDSKQVISCIEIKKTLTGAVLKKLIAATINANLGTSPLAMNGVQFLNIFAFSSKVSIEKVGNIIFSEIESHLSKFRSTTKSGKNANACIMHLVLPRIYFFDRTGYLTVHCKINSQCLCDISVSVCASSLEGHSLGEFIVSSLSIKKNEQDLNERNFLTYPLVMSKSTKKISDIHLYKKISMSEIELNFPNDLLLIRNLINAGKKPYGMLVPAGLDINNFKNISNLLKIKGVAWLLV